MTAFLLTVTAVIAYFFGSISTVNLTSNLYFHRNIKREYTLDNPGITRFLHDYRIKGMAVLFLTELLRLLIPMIIGGILLGIVDHSEVGHAFAMFCIILGTVFPIMYRFKGASCLPALFVCTAFIGGGVGFATLFVFFVVYFLTRYVSLAALCGTAMMCLVTLMTVDTKCAKYVILLTGLVVFISYRHNIVKLFKREEVKFKYQKDLSYKFDKY